MRGGRRKLDWEGGVPEGGGRGMGMWGFYGGDRKVGVGIRLGYLWRFSRFNFVTMPVINKMDKVVYSSSQVLLSVSP